MRGTISLVSIYLAAIVLADLASAAWGPSVSVVNAFLLIGLDFTTRDTLQDAWGKRMPLNMGLLILAGAGLSYLINHKAARVGMASVAAFSSASLIGALVYWLCRKMPYLRKVNIANIAQSAIDSLIFPTIAFGGIMWLTSGGQFMAKLAGGALWGLLFAKIRRAPAPRPEEEER